MKAEYLLPIGYTASVRMKFHCDSIILSPEFLRESKALFDNVYPKASVRKSWAKMTGKLMENELYAA